MATSPDSLSPDSPDSPDPVSRDADPRDSLILHATDNGVSWITLNRPAAMNALTWDQREHLMELLADASADPEVRAVVITATAPTYNSIRRDGDFDTLIRNVGRLIERRRALGRDTPRVRFDIVSVYYGTEITTPEITLFKNAFPMP